MFSFLRKSKMNTVTVEGSPTTLDIPAGKTLLEAMLDAGLAMPHDCKVGSCGTCKFKLVSGKIGELSPSALALEGDELRSGFRLAWRDSGGVMTDYERAAMQRYGRTDVLLGAIAATPDPDATLGNLVAVSDSLGGKGVLWELFSCHPPSLDLTVRLCSSSPFLATLLVGNPGMIDELLDSLLIPRLPTPAELDASLADL